MIRQPWVWLGIIFLMCLIKSMGQLSIFLRELLFHTLVSSFGTSLATSFTTDLKPSYGNVWIGNIPRIRSPDIVYSYHAKQPSASYSSLPQQVHLPYESLTSSVSNINFICNKTSFNRFCFS